MMPLSFGSGISVGTINVTIVNSAIPTGQAAYTTAGTYSYHCAYHPSMTGSVAVNGASGATTAPATTFTRISTVTYPSGGTTITLGSGSDDVGTDATLTTAYGLFTNKDLIDIVFCSFR